MIGLDTNILVRYLTQDDPAQARKATDIFEKQLSTQKPGFVSIVTITETVWLLDRAYGYSREEIALAIERMLQTDVLAVENEQEVFTAMTALKDGTGEFSDALIATLGEKAGCSHTLTFDRKAARLRGFELV